MQGNDLGFLMSPSPVDMRELLNECLSPSSPLITKKYVHIVHIIAHISHHRDHRQFCTFQAGVLFSKENTNFLHISAHFDRLGLKGVIVNLITTAVRRHCTDWYEI